MIHKIAGWCAGYIRIRIPARTAERFVNLCRNSGIYLWGAVWEAEGRYLYAYVAKRDYFRIQPLVEKTGTFPLVTERIGGSFWLQRAGRRASFWWGIVVFLLMLAVLSDRIWGIYIEGQSYHTQESMLSYLEEKGIYGGVRSSQVQCSQIEAGIRKDFQDIGWTSIEKAGSKLYVRIQEITLIGKEEEPKPGNLVADKAGKVVSIVTRKGKAKVRAKDQVKKGQVLISGRVKIIGDNDEVVGKTHVHAEGTVVIQNQMEYNDQLEKVYVKKERTGRELALYQLSAGGRDLFLYNPLNYLESYKKYDIIREGGVICPFISLRFPVSLWKKTFREIREERAVYSPQEAEEILQERYQYYLEQLKQKGYTRLSGKLEIRQEQGGYRAHAVVTGNRRQEEYQEISAKPLTKVKKTGEEE